MTGSLRYTSGINSKWEVSYFDTVAETYYSQAVNYPPVGSNTWNYYYDLLQLSPDDVPVSFSLGDSSSPGAVLESKE